MFKRFKKQWLTAVLLALPLSLAAQESCEPNYSTPYVTVNPAAVPVSMGNNQFNTFMTVGQPFISTATNYSVNSTASGFWSTYLKEPRPPIVWGSDGDFQDMVLVEWQVEDDRTGPPVTGSNVSLYRNGYYLTQLPVTQTQYQDFNVFAGETYVYGVTSSNDMGNSHTDNDVGFLNPNGVITGHVETPSGNPMLDTKVLLTPNLGRSAFFDGQSYIYYFDESTSANRLFGGVDSSYTIETWFRSIETTQQTIFAAVDSATADHYILLELTDQGQIHWQHSPVAGASGTSITTVNGFTGSGPNAAWHHLAAVFHDNAMTLYVDAVIVGTATATGIINDDVEMVIAKRDPKTPELFYSGRLDDFRIWSTARSWKDIRRYMDLTLSGEEDNLAAYWKFDEVEGETIFDLTDNDVDGNICGVDRNNFTAPVYVGALTDSSGNYTIRGIYFAGGTTFTVTPSKTTPIGRSLEFDGVDNYLSFSGQRIDLTLGYTLEGWFKTSAGVEQTLFAGVDPANDTPHVTIRTTASGNVSAAHLDAAVVSGVSYNDNLWHHFALTVDNTDMTLFVDGINSGTATVSSPVDVLTEIVMGRQAPEVSALYFNGYLDEFRLWDYARTSTQVQGGMNQTLDGDEFGLANYWRLNEGSGDLVSDATGALVTGTLQGVMWSEDIPLNENFEHYYEPESRQATLNHSNTSVDLVDFTDNSLIAISGFVRYVDTACFQQGVEMLLNGHSFLPPIYTDEDGKYIVEIEPGSTGEILSTRYGEHEFIPPFIELPLISTPITALYFNDSLTKDADGLVAGGECEYPITPSSGDIVVTLRAVNGCIEQTVVPSTSTGTWDVADLPPLIYQVTVDHPNPAIDAFFTGDTLSLENGNGHKSFIYRAQPEISVTGFPEDDCALRVMDQYGTYNLTASIYEAYTNYSTGITSTCAIDSGYVEIVSDLGNATTTVESPFSDGLIDFSVSAGTPNILGGGAHPYQKSIQVIATDLLERNATVSEWTYVVGQRPREEAAFATTTPEVPIMIIHAPPGDGSGSSWSSGSSLEQSLSFSTTYSDAIGLFVGVSAGVDVEFSAGFGVMVTTEVNATMDFTTTTSISKSMTNSQEQVWSFETSETIGTAGGGDVYMGGAINIIYGITDILDIDGSCTPVVTPEIIIVPEGFATTYIYSEANILDAVIPNLITIGDTQSAALWQNFVNVNQQNKTNAVFTRNLSFDGGATYDYEETSSVTQTATYEMEIEIATEIAIEAGIEVNGVGVSGGSNINFAMTTGSSSSESVTHSNTIAYSLADDEGGDSFTLDVKRDQVYGTPVFTTLSGFSSCPWEPSTVPFDGASLQVDPPVQVDVPPDGEAVFTLSLGNLSAVGADRDYDLRVINSSNPDGAVIAINGIILENAISYSIPYGENIETIMTVARGPVAYLYEGLQLQLVSPCEYADGSGAWSDTISVNIEFQTPCSESHIAVPENNWLITSADASDTLWVTVDNFDRFNTNLDRIELQYRQASGFNGGSSDGEDDGEDLIVLSGATGDDDPETDTPQIPGAVKSGTIPLSQDSDDEDPAPRSGDWFVAASVNGADLIDDYVLMPWNISPSIVIDGTYELRSVAVCDAGLTPGTSSIVSGRIDRAAPQVLGAPTPITGILGPDNIISITYNENIECGAISIGAQHITLTNTVTGNPIDFTHTCGGNMIVIEPNIQNHFIENQTLRASVGPIEDLYGNATVNPAMWEFFVNRNPVQWIGTGIENVIIYIDETYSTTRTLFNAGGSNRSFEITNIPAWMTVYPTQGILPPGGAETISFILSNEPGSGQFTDTIYASGVLGDEPMPVDIRVLCHEPSWDLNPGDYQYSMNIIASLTTEGQLSEDIYDFVAVFVGDELRGIESIQYVPELESLPNIHPYQVYLTVFSNSVSGEDLELVVWDASECTLLGQVLETYTFDANEVLGNLAFPETITATNQVIQNIDFTGGWNWFSLNLTPADMSVGSILGDLSPVTNDLIKGQTTYGQFAESYGWLGTLSSLNNHEMYMLHLADPGTLEIVGYPVDIELDTIAVTSGWNWISFTPQQSYDVNDALMHLTSFSGDLIKSQFNFSMYLEGIGWLGNLNFMNPLFGYQLYSQLPGQLYYPLQQELARDVDQQDEIPLTESNSQDWLVNTAAYEENMTLVGRLSSQSGQLYDPDMLVAAFVGDECRGVSRIQYIPELEDYRVFLVIYGSMDESDVAFKVYSPEYDQVLDVQETIAFEGSDIIGSPDAPMTLNAGSGSSNGSLLPSVFALGQNFPNPFNPVTMIEYSLPEDVNVSISLYNIMGQKVMELVNEFQPAGYRQVQWNGTDDKGMEVPSGIYIYRLSAGEYQSSRKLILMK